MDVADLPEIRTKSSPLHNKIRKLLAQGYTPVQIATSASGDPVRRKAIRSMARHIYYTDPELANFRMAAAKGAVLEATEDIADALVRRAKRGRVDAAKFAFEWAGAYVPVQHRKTEHSGEVKISVAVARPQKQIEEPIVDAEVVDED